MKKINVLTGVILMCIISLGYSEGIPKVVASIEVYSGRGVVQWNMTQAEMSNLAARIQGLPAVQLKRIPTEGYVVIKNYGNPSFPYSQVYVFTKGMVLAESASSKTSYLDSRGELLTWLIEIGNRHDPAYVAPKYKTLPQGTPSIAVIPSSFEGSVSQGETLKQKFTVFSEGNAPLKGTIDAPASVVLDRREYSLDAISGIQDFSFSIDTSTPGEKAGSIVIKSNDPSKAELEIPFKINVVEKQGSGEEATDSTLAATNIQKQGLGNYLMYMGIVVALVLLIGFFMYSKKRK
jgi:hypothetical protein